MAKLDPQVHAHLEWLGFVRPTGLVVSAPALVRAGAILDQRDAEGQRLLRAGLLAPNVARESASAFGDAADARIDDFDHFARTVLGWRFSPKGYAGVPMAPIPPELEVALPDAGELLRPDFAVRELEPATGAAAWQLLVQVLPAGTDFDREANSSSRLELSAHSRMERLLRQTGVPAGLLVNGRALRLISAPRAESSGWLDFRVADMVQTAGRPISAALRLLLSEERLLALPRHQRLAALLSDSRKFQNEVSEKLAEQVLHALYELLRGFQAAHDASSGALLRQVLAERPDEVYGALLTVILRMVFLLYAEERGLLPGDETFQRYYSLAGLHERLREDAALFPDTMEQRYGAWAQLVALFRMVHDGAAAQGMTLPPREGVLFDPDRFAFLEGRVGDGTPAGESAPLIEPPLVPDGTIYRALEKLLVLDGERISYRALDVEQIGSVYETMMGFRLETATGRSVAIKAQKKQGAPTALDLDALLAEGRGDRAKTVEQRADRKLTDRVKKAVADAGTLDALHAALLPVIDTAATPDLVPRGAMVLQPSEARRRSGSHYTPRELTEPIVRTTLDPILARLRGADGSAPRAEAILELKVCDPAMGSGAFLVEACRYLGDALVDAWRVHGDQPTIPPDEDEIVFARRLVAQRCLYGVDRNPMAVDLAKVSLWLVTLAKDHALTFVDHALRHGDSLVGLSRQQIENFHWDTNVTYDSPFRARMREQVARAADLRRRIREAGEEVSDAERRSLWDHAQAELDTVRLYGDLVVSAFFGAEKAKDRERRRNDRVASVARGETTGYAAELRERREADPPLVPFHWEIEFPEAFDRRNAGFDAFVGNPPFVGGRKVSGSLSDQYAEWLAQIHDECPGNADLVAHFFRRVFDLVRVGGAFGLIATKTIGQGDTRSGGLRWIRAHGGQIFAARRRLRWPGMAAVVVSVVHATKGTFEGVRLLDGRPVERITAFLFHRGGDDDPAKLSANADRSFQGSIVLGLGFTFDDKESGGVASPVAELNRIVASDPRTVEVTFPYVGAEEVNASPDHLHRRYVIDFRDRSEQDCRDRWPGLMAIVEAKVKPERTRVDRDGRFVLREPLPTRWWQHADKRPALYGAIAGLESVLVTGSAAVTHHMFAVVSARQVFSHKLIVFPLHDYAAFAILQSRVHEEWSALCGTTFGSGDALTYNPTKVFLTFPFPTDTEATKLLDTVGARYRDIRSSMMQRSHEGLTKTYGRFHDPDERDPDILKLRELHAAMDRAVLDAYGWHDIPTDFEFLLDYEIDEDEWSEKKKKPWRYRWPDDVRDEVLARLLELNAERAREEALAGAAASPKRVGKRTKKATSPEHDSGTEDLFS